MDNFKDFINENFVSFGRPKIDQNTEHEILSMYQDKFRYKVSDISEITGISTAGIYRILEKYGIHPHRIQPGENHSLVAQYANTGLPAKKISELTGYSRRQVYNILRDMA
jgi:hypothetical protein